MCLCLEGLEHLEDIRLNKCIYIEDACLERLSQIKTLQDSVKNMTVVSCGNVTDKGLIALHQLRYDNSIFHFNLAPYYCILLHILCMQNEDSDWTTLISNDQISEDLSARNAFPRSIVSLS